MRRSRHPRARRLVLPLSVFLLVVSQASVAQAAVTITRAEVNGGSLRIEGRAAANRTITVDTVAMGTSDGSGAFRIDRSGFTPPADCTVDVNDGSATPANARLSGCTVTAPPPPPPSAPPAPTGLAPANGASVVVPFAISWSAVSDPDGIVAYNWQVSTSSTLAPVIQLDSTSGQTQDTVSGLANGTYFWRVQAVDGALNQGAWSATRSFIVSGAGTAEPGSPTLDPPKAGTQFHPFESITFTWSAVPGAASYVFEAGTDPSFPVGTRVHFDNISDTTTSVVIGDFCGGCEQGNYVARVYAVGANGNRGVPSNSVAFGVFYNAPLPPPPRPLSPPNGAAVTLPVTLDWTDVPNPQPSGYDLEISRNSTFTDVEEFIPQLNDSQRTVLSLTAGTKFWRVRSVQGNASPTTAAVTAWSAVSSFTISGGGPGVASVSLPRTTVSSGDEIVGDIQLTGPAPAGGAVVQLSISDPDAKGTLPASVPIPAGFAFAQFRFVVGQVTASTPVTLTGTLGTSSASFAFTVNPPSLRELFTDGRLSGGARASGIVMLNGQAPAGGALVSLSSDSPAASPPPTVTVPAGVESLSFTFPTAAVSSTTTVTVTATYGGGSVFSRMTLTPQVPPTSLTLDPTTTTGNSGSFGRVTIAAAQADDVQIPLSTTDAAVASLPPYVTVPAGTTAGGFLISTQPPAASTPVTISASAAGVTKSATLTVTPFDTGPPGTPSLISPAADARFASGQSVVFDWSDVTGATTYQIQIDDSSMIGSPFVLNRTGVTVSRFAINTLPSKTMWWRVRAVNSSGTVGPWSTVRRFEVR